MSESATLEQLSPVLGLYYLALTGQMATIAPERPGTLVDATDRIYLPPTLEGLSASEPAEWWYVAAVAHRAARTMYQTHHFGDDQLDTPDGFAGLAEQLVDDKDRRLFFELFTTCEAFRTEQILRRNYPGCREVIDRARTQALDSIALDWQQPPREVFARSVTRASLGSVTEIQSVSNRPLVQAGVMLLAAVIEALDGAPSESSDSATCAAALHSFIHELPNMWAVDPDATASAAAIVPGTADPISEYLHRFGSGGPAGLEDDAAMRVSLDRPAYRSSLNWSPGARLDEPAREEFYVFTSTEDRGVDEPCETSSTIQVRSEVTPREEELRGPPQPLPHEHREVEGFAITADASASLQARNRHEWLYPEWHQALGAQVPGWTRVVHRHRVAGRYPGRPIEALLRTNARLVSTMAGQLSAMRQQGAGPGRREEYGDAMDLDAAVEALVDGAAGVAPDARVYRPRRPRFRDIAVAILLDTSASTAERVGSSPRAVDGSRRADFGDGFVSAALAAKGYRCVLDTQVESVSLLAAAMDGLGDSVGMFGFSSRGRAAVSVEVLKAYDEPMNDLVLRRLGSVRASGATRMGAAIRHVDHGLQLRPEATKMMLVVSDGYPYDVDYGYRAGQAEFDLEHAVADTIVAMEDARRRGIHAGILGFGSDSRLFLEQDAQELCQVVDGPDQLLSGLHRLYALLFTRRSDA